jgi:putative heme iron utilization protein
MYALEITGAHYVGGFGRIVDLAPPDLLTRVEDARPLVEAEPGIIAHMNEDHRDAVALYATMLAQSAQGDWRLVGVDPHGIDLLHRSNAARVEFPARVRTPAEARAALVAMAKEARDRLSQNAS